MSEATPTKPVDEIRVVIDYLDQLMAQGPNQQLANASNYLEELLAAE